MNLFKKKLNRRLLRNSKGSLIFLLVFMIVMLNMQMTKVKAAGLINFDFQNYITGSTNVGDPNGINNSVTQTQGGYTVTVTQDKGTYLQMHKKSCNFLSALI